MSKLSELHNPNRWDLCITDATNVSKRIERAHEVGPTKEDVLDILERFQQHHSQFRAEFSSRLTDIRRSILNIPLPVSNELKLPEIAKSKTSESKKEIDRKPKKKFKKLNSKPTAKGLPDLTDCGDIDSTESAKKKPIIFKSPTQTTVRVNTVKIEKARPQSATISSTVIGERDFAEIKSPWARQILKRRLSTCEVPQPDPLPSGARVLATTKRRVSYAAVHTSYNPDHSVPAVNSKREETSPVAHAVKRGGDFHFGSDNDEDDSGRSDSEDVAASNEVVPLPPSSNISEIAKMVLKKLNCAQAAKLKKDAESDAKPIVEAPFSDYY